MTQRLLCAFACLSAAANVVSAFSTARSPSPSFYALQHKSSSVLRSAESVADTTEDTDDVTCFVVNDEEIITEGEKPHVVCTSEPDDYAWFNGVDPKTMRETDGTDEGAEACVEGESYKGTPEWECD